MELKALNNITNALEHNVKEYIQETFNKKG